MNIDDKEFDRVIGFDSHPDSFTAGILKGKTPASAIVEKMFDKLPMSQLQSWAQKNTTEKDLIVLESSGNSFKVVRTLAAVGRRALVLESNHLGKLKEGHANNDKISAVRIGKAFLSGTAKTVWVPDPQTQERRDLLHAHRKAVKRCTQMRNRLQSYLSDNGVRLKKETKLARNPEQALVQIRAVATWQPRQLQVIEGMVMELAHADRQREHWRSVMAQEVANDATMLSAIRLCGVRDVVAFALVAIIGDIGRFASAASLVKYIGLVPAFDDSGEGKWRGGISHAHGRKDLRSLLVESAQCILRCSTNPLAQWGKKLLARKGEKKLVVTAMARKLAVAVWYLLKGKWTPLEEIDLALEMKMGKIISRIAARKELEIKMGKTKKELMEQMREKLKNGREYVLDPNKKFTPKPKAETLSKA